MPYQSLIKVWLAEGVKESRRDPEPFMDRFKEAGIKVIHKCVAVRRALKAERIGGDVVSIDGIACLRLPG